MKILSSPAKSTNASRKFPMRILLVPIVVVVIFSVCSKIFRPMVAEKIAAEIASTPNSGSIPSTRITTQQNKTDASRINVARDEKIQTAEEQARACRTEVDYAALPSFSNYFYSRPRQDGLFGKDYIFLSPGAESVRDEYTFLVMVPCMTRLGWTGTKQLTAIGNFLAKFEASKNKEIAQLPALSQLVARSNRNTAGIVQTKPLLSADTYNPFGADTYNPFQVAPPPEAAPEPMPVSNEAVPAPQKAAIPNTGVPELAPWPEYSAKAGATPAVYNDYVNKQMPDYLAQLGYTPAEVADVIQQFKKAVPSPRSSYFTNVQLTNGVSIDIPSHWTVLSQDSRKTIMAAGEALSENAGIANSGGKRKNLLAVSAVPSPTGATIRVNVSTPPEYTQADLAKFSTDGLEQLRTGFLVVSKQLEASGGPKIIEIPVPRVERLGNNLAVVMSYKRQGANGSSPWQVNQYKVPLSDRLIEITLSHRAEDGMVWKPILEKVKNSVRLQ